ncbi:hypothetical protein N0V86_004149 [Didymella sp. IMI 355093]|nr:hypothetical protein N0V86_004149 [Didymella sp. IMI 355093]
MSQGGLPNPPRGEVALQHDPGLRILVEDVRSHSGGDGPISPALSPREFTELWNDVRAQTDTTRSNTEESTQDPSYTEASPNSARKPRVRTNEQDVDFTATSLRDIYAVIGDDSRVTEVDLENLDRHLPKKILDNTRDQAQDCIRRGDTEEARKVLEVALAQLQDQLDSPKHVNLTPWKISVAEILIDQGRRHEARDVLSEVHSRANGESNSTDANYERMIEMAQLAETELDRYRRAEDWDKAREVGEKLHGIHPSYFDFNKPMERFNQVRRILNAGMLKEVASKDNNDPGPSSRYLAEALEIYNHGCYASEVFNEFFDAKEGSVSGFDHSDCANIFFSAARVCHQFDSTGYPVAPTLFRCKGPTLTCSNWKHQALYFLEKGRSRALLDSINRGCVVDAIRRRLIKKTIILVSEAARTILRQRSSALSSMQHSRAPSVSRRMPVAQMPTLTNSDLTLASQERSRSDSFVQPEMSPFREVNKRLLTLQTSNLSESSLPSFPTSPASALTPTLTEGDYHRLNIRLRWRKCLLGVLTRGQVGVFDTIEELRAHIPPDTLVVEFALSSTAPCGIMVVIVSSNSVRAVEWKEANVEKIQTCIGALRASMQTSDSRMKPGRQCRHHKRPAGPTRKESYVIQEQLDGLLREFVVAPVKPHLEGKNNLIIIPSGDLAHVPWRIFFDLPVTVVPSLEIWARLQAQAQVQSAQAPNLSVVSTAPEDRKKMMNNEPGSVRNIPYSRIEALYVARLHNQLPFLADDQDHAALEDLTKDAQILHICAHSNFEPDSPMSSSLELFKEPLTIGDWHKLSIKADLVVFSSCLSGYSKAYDSGSTIGFAHTLLGTGTKAFIGSLWEVDDHATLLLMTLFYEELREALPVAHALYTAQKRMQNLDRDDLHEIVDKLEDKLDGIESRTYVLKINFLLKELRETDPEEWQQPRYWAAFVLTGYGSSNIYPTGAGQLS